jgi:PKD repeat protein
VAPHFDNEYFHLIYQHDNEPGPYIENGGPGPSENHISYMKIEDPNYLYINFDSFQDTIHEGENVQFTNSTTGNPGPTYYQWHFEGGSPQTSGASQPSITYYNQGQYDVKLIASNDLITDSVTIEDYITVLPETGIKKTNGLNHIGIYPNPTEGEIIITSSFQQSINLKIFDLKGNVILERINYNISRLLNIDLSGNPHGIYLLEINCGNKKVVDKIILQN